MDFHFGLRRRLMIIALSVKGETAGQTNDGNDKGTVIALALPHLNVPSRRCF